MPGRTLVDMEGMAEAQRAHTDAARSGASCPLGQRECDTEEVAPSSRARSPWISRGEAEERRRRERHAQAGSRAGRSAASRAMRTPFNRSR